MVVYKCKMCGGTIEFNQGDTVGVCDSCGTKQTLPRLDDDKKANLYDRATIFGETMTLIRQWEYMSRYSTRTTPRRRPIGRWCSAAMVSSMWRNHLPISGFPL